MEPTPPIPDEPPPRFTPDLAARLEALGLRNPNACRWSMFRPSPDDVVLDKICFAEWICLCTGNHRRITMVPFHGLSRPILLGQCSDCLQVRWKYWSGLWTGPTRLEPSRPMYTPGHGVPSARSRPLKPLPISDPSNLYPSPAPRHP